MQKAPPITCVRARDTREVSGGNRSDCRPAAVAIARAAAEWLPWSQPPLLTRGSTLNVFFDCDFTLTGIHGGLRPFAREVMEQLNNDGHSVYIWSGVRVPWDIYRNF